VSKAYVVGHILVKNVEKWDRYRTLVPATLAPWGAELVLRGKKVAILAGEHSYSDIVVIRFPDKEVVNSWHSSPAYQSLIPLREQAAEMILLSYEANASKPGSTCPVFPAHLMASTSSFPISTSRWQERGANA
jgi:uncharacterized protein (DUF1330 family)